MEKLNFSFERRIRLPGQDWGEYRTEAQCRHFGDINAIATRTADRFEYTNPVDHTGRAVQAEYRIVSGSTGETLKSFIVGV